jgi:hypothetical protein
MSRLMRIIVAGALLVSFGSLALAAETKEEKMKDDESQAKYTRKSITYLGIYPDSGVTVPADQMAVIESEIRKLTELKRFDYNAVSLTGIYTIDQFVAELREYVKKRSVDRATAESEYEARFKRAKVLASDIDRIMNSAYFYQIKVYLFKTKRAKCPDGKLEAALLGCIPGTEGMLSTVNASTNFYKANIADETKPPYELIKEVKHTPVKGFKAFKVVEVQPEHMAKIRTETSLAATKTASHTLAEFLSKGMKQIPVFQLKTPVTAVKSDGVEFMLGEDVGVGLDDTYDVTVFDVSGVKTLIGYVKVREIGDAKQTGEGSPSYAETVKEKKKFKGIEQLYEHPMIGLAIGLYGVFEVAFKDVLGKTDSSGNTEMGFYPGVGLYIDKDLGNLVGWPEFYVSVEGDILFVGDYFGSSVMLVHAMLGVKKKWYMESLVFSVGLRGGISYFKVDNYEDNAIGGGVDAVFGLEYYFMPEFSLYFKLAGRFFTNPLDFGGGTLDAEMAVQANLGAFLAF